MNETYSNKENLNVSYESVGARLITLHFTPEAKEAMDHFEIIQDVDFSWEGAIDVAFQNELAKQLKTAGNNEDSVIDTVTSAITENVSCYVEEKQSNEALVYVRATVPNELFNVPRWHSDGSFFKPGQVEKKLVFSPKGPATLIGKVNDVEDFNKDERILNNLLDEKELSDPEVIALREQMATYVSPLVSAEFGQGVEFSVGGDEATVHSEPLQSQVRLFVSVVAK